MAQELTVSRLREVMRYDPETGRFTWLLAPNRRIKRDLVRGANVRGYRRIKIDGRIYFASRLAWLYTYGDWPQQQVDHINGDSLDDRIANLRDVSCRVNVQNRHRAARRSRTGLLGVKVLRGGRYGAQITRDSRGYWLGDFATPVEAHAAYMHAKQKFELTRRVQ